MDQSPSSNTWPDPSLEWDLINYFFMRPSQDKFISNRNLDNNQSVSEELIQKLLLWTMEACDELEFSYQVKQRALILIRRFIATQPLESRNLQLLGASALHLCSKFEDEKGLTFEKLRFLSAHQYSPLDFHNIQLQILSMNGYNISFPIPGDYIRLLLNAAVIELNRIIFKDIDELINYALTISALARFPPKVIGISCLFYFLFFNHEQEVLDFMTRFLLKNKIIRIILLEEFITRFHPLLTEDPTLLQVIVGHFTNFKALPSSPLHKEQLVHHANQVEESKTTSDSSLTEKIVCETEEKLVVQPFNMLNCTEIEEMKDEENECYDR